MSRCDFAKSPWEDSELGVQKMGRHDDCRCEFDCEDVGLDGARMEVVV